MPEHFANNVRLQEDSLNRLYLSQQWFATSLATENELLLKAISTQQLDSVNSYLKEFAATRHGRRVKFKNAFGYNLSDTEDFWEKIEGGARYVEYYAGLEFSKLHLPQYTACDSLFRNFAAFRSSANIEASENFRTRTRIMPAYYYVTGFNMCRVLDRLHVRYKQLSLADPSFSLFEALSKEIRRR